MGKPYGHQYFMAGNLSSRGLMVCAKCNQPIFNHAHDWMAYQKPENGDWGYVCFHRKCYDDQSGWLKIEKAEDAKKKLTADLTLAVGELLTKFNITSGTLAYFIEEEYQP